MDKKEKAAAAAAIAATIAASGAAVDVSFDNPAEILQQDMSRTPTVEYVDLDQGQDDGQDQDDKKQIAQSGQTAFQKFILGLPLPVRVFFVLPMWAIGHAVTWAGGLLFAAATPLLNGILSFLLLFAVIAGAFAVTVKAIFPDLPWGKIINRHTIKGLFFVSAGIYVADLVLGFAWDDYAQFKLTIEGAMSLAGLGGVTVWFARREHRRRKRLEEKAAAKAAYEAEHPDELVFKSLGQTFKIRNPEK